MNRFGVIRQLIALAVLACQSSVQAAPQVCVLQSTANANYNQVGKSLSSALRKKGGDTKVHIASLDDMSAESFERHCASNLVVAVGTAATRYSLENFPAGQVVSTFVAKNTLENLLKNRGAKADIGLVGAVYLDQPARRLLKLVKLINPNTQTVASLTGPLSSARLPPLERAAASEGLTIHSRTIDVERNPVRQLERVMSGADAYLVLPDTAQINRNTAKWIIYLSYKFRLPVIAYSRKYVDAGALVSLFTTPQQMGEQTAEIVHALMSPGSGKRERPLFVYPRYFEIAVNDKVRRALNIARIDRAQLKSQLQAAESGEPQPAVLDHER